MKKWNRWCCRATVAGFLATRMAMAQPPPLCLLCFDGSSLVLDTVVDESIFGSNVTCDALASDAVNLDGDSDECGVLQLTALQAKCCPDSSGSLCTLCPNGSEDILFPDRLLPSSSNDAESISCVDLIQNNVTQAELLLVYEGDAGVCENTLLRRSAAYCGCPNVESQCDLCSGEELLMDQGLALINLSCSDMAYQVSLQPQGECEQSFLEGFDVAALCCANMERLAQCTLCSAIEQLIPSRVVTTSTYGDVTCGDVEEAAALATTGASCRLLLQEVGRRCCLEIPDPDSCELRCPEGSLPEDPFKRDPVTGHTCQSLAAEYAKIPGDECTEAAAIVGFDAVAFCCPAVEPPDVCYICPPGETLMYPERVLFAYDEHSCVTLTESLKYVVGKGCNNILDESRANRHCKCRPDILPIPPPPALIPDTIERASKGSSYQLGLWATVLALLLAIQN